MKKIAFVSGATSGIGEAVALKLAENKFNLIIAGRRTERLKLLENKIRDIFEVEVISLSFDVRVLEEVQNAVQTLPDNWKNIDLLVNNAGLAVGLSTIQEGVVDDWERMIDTNIKGLLYLSREISPFMVKRKQGHIINIGSIAGKEVYPNGNVYCGTKHAVDAITKGMRIDLVHDNVKVTGIHPGMVDTEFSLVRFKGDKEKANAVYNELVPLYADDIAEAVLFCATRPASVNINDMVIMPTIQASATVVHRD
ncbi:MAG: SDR family NAD(P)-dependent oxidoreductase [Bacteroidota bacterium]|nr:SDR family NAD(P)-dependent oxidoreductase [Bacteroidota bacterium]